jgi:hypothetical protein
MNSYRRAFGAIVTTAMIGSGLALGAGAPANAAAPTPGAAAEARVDLLTLLTPPSVAGSGLVGEALTLTDPVWLTSGLVTNTYQWQRDGDPIPGATASSYVPTAADAGHQVTALVTGHVVAGLLTVTVPALSNALHIVVPPEPGLGDLTALVLPVLSGTPDVGSVLSLSPVQWSLPGVTTTYQWLRDGAPIPGATGLGYETTLDDAGHQLTVLVTGNLLGVVATELSNGLDIPLPTDPGDPGDPGDPEPGDELTALVTPVLTGVPAVGQLLSLSQVQWSLPGVTTTIQWLSDGVPIPGAQGLSFLPGPEHAGTEITAVVTGTLAGLPLVQLITNGLGISAPGAPLATSVPTTSGTGKVGSVLTGTAPTWDTEGVTTTYQWQRNTTPIPGATSLTYTVKPEDVGKALRLQATGTKGDATGTASSATVLGRLGELLATAAPSITGLAKAGSVLTVQPGVWGLGTLPTFGYQWYADNRPISGATGSQYVVKVTDAGRRLAVLVTATRLGFTQAGAPAGPVTVAKVASRTTLKLLRKKLTQGKAGLLRITLAPGSLRPSGKVKVFDGKKLLKTYTVRVADNGTRIVKLPKLRPGKHKLTARFVGSRATNPSKSAPVVLTISRKR